MKTETPFPRVRFSAMWSEKLGAEIAKRVSEPYPIECHHRSEDFRAIERAVAQGIDSHLQAVFFNQSEGEHGKVRLEIEPRSLPVLVRRLMESDDEHAQDLASCICETLNLELI